MNPIDYQEQDAVGLAVLIAAKEVARPKCSSTALAQTEAIRGSTRSP